MSYLYRSELGLINKFRLLWGQHCEWKRMAIASIVLQSPTEKEVVSRLLRNPKDFALVLRIFYGDTFANKFSDLLTEHLTIAAQFIKAAMKGNNDEATALEIKWYQNAEEIATLLGNTNVFWKTESWRDMLFKHLALVKEEAITMINAESQKNVDIYDSLELQTLEMADTMSDGIVRTFVKMFC